MKNATFDAAVKYTRAGLRVVPVPHGSKKVVLKGWPELRLAEKDLPQHFGNGPVNIGVLMGEPSGWIVDVDLDHPRAVELADQFLPPTPAVFGRPGNARSHRIYRIARPATTKKHKSKSAGMIVELRSTSAMTIFPPSTHESGEPIRWEDENAEPALVDPEELLTATKNLADAVLIELGEKDPPNIIKFRKNKPAAEPSGDVTERCLAAMLAMDIADHKDGSSRLFAAACRCVEHDLSDEDALSAIRTYECQRPFRTEWTDEDIRKRLRDAEQKCMRGAALSLTAALGKVMGRGSEATQLLSIADKRKFDLFNDGEDALVTVPLGEHFETWLVRSKAFRSYLARTYYVATKDAPNDQALRDATSVLAARALYDGPRRVIATRIVEHAGVIWLDLADEQRRVVRVDTHGWSVQSEAPVRFLRRRGMLALPEPQRGGALSDLRELINLRDDDDWALVSAWLVAAARPRGPFPALAVNGEQGSAKSTLTRMFRGLIDPNRAALRSVPRDERDLMIAANAAWVLAFDNFSDMPRWLSDALCRLSTGGGFSTRELYTNDEEILFDAMRPVVLNGIECVATRSDLLDRCVSVTLPAIPDSKRLPEAELWARYEAIRPIALGGLLDAVVVGMRRLPDLEMKSFPRMADFGMWGVACEPGTGLSSGTFMRAYCGSRDEANDLAIEANPVGPALRAFMASREDWSGTAKELLTALSSGDWTDDQTRKLTSWPKEPRGLTGALQRLAPNLRSIGIDVALPDRRTGRLKRRVITIKNIAARQAAQAAQAANSVGAAENAVLAPCEVDPLKGAGGPVGSCVDRLRSPSASIGPHRVSLQPLVRQEVTGDAADAACAAGRNEQFLGDPSGVSRQNDSDTEWGEV